MAIDVLIREARGMSDEAIMEVVRFMRFIKTEPASQRSASPADSTSKKVLRHAGKYCGKGWMSDNFDETLDEFKEYM